MSTKKVKLGGTPKSFEKIVEIVQLDGSVGEINFKFIYRTRSQYAELIDENVASAKSKDEFSNSDEKTLTGIYAHVDQQNADHVLKIAEGWDLDEPMTKAALLQLENENAGALVAISATYRQAVAEARVKNSVR